MDLNSEMRENAIDFIKSNDPSYKVKDLENYSLITLIQIKTSIEIRKYRNNSKKPPAENSDE